MQDASKKIEGTVGSKKLFENDKVIVWDFVLQPGETTPLHQHERSYMWFGACPNFCVNGSDFN